jgi:hypothetical protein
MPVTHKGSIDVIFKIKGFKTRLAGFAFYLLLAIQCLYKKELKYSFNSNIDLSNIQGNK